MTRLTYSFPISDTARFAGDTDVDSWYMTIGKWIVEVKEGNLIVRGLSTPEVLLTVKA